MELVVGASDATMKSLLGKLGGLLAQEYTLIRGVRGDIQYITDELATMQAFLGDLGSTQEDHDRRIKNWMKQIRDMAYDMEDCIDDFAHRLPHDPLSDTTCSFIVTRIYELRTFWPRRQIASKIAELKVRAQHIAERRGRYGVDNPGKKDGSSPGAGATHALTSGIGEHLMPNRQLIHTLNPEGVDEDMKKLKTWMENKHSGPAVLSIVGFGGVGKTTIATKLYRDFGKEFDCRALVTVSQYYDEDQVLMDILGQIKPRDGDEEQQDRNTGTPAEKNLAAGIKPGLAKRLVPLFRGHSKQGNDGGTQWTQSKIDNMNRDQLIEELRSRLQGKRYSKPMLCF